MFRFSDEPVERYARAIGRIVFGAVMLAGVAVLLQRLFEMRHPETNKVIAATWIIALFCGFVARHVAVIFGDRKSLQRIFVLSYAVPALGIALLLPLSLHLIVALALGVAGDFDVWVQMSLHFAGPAHIAFAFLATRRAVRIAQGRDAQHARDVFVATLLVASIPFALILLPPLIVAATGLPILPLLERMRPLIERERDLGVAAPLPIAVVV